MKNYLENWVFNGDYKSPNLTPEVVELVKKYEHLKYNSAIADAMIAETGAENKPCGTSGGTIGSIVYHARKILDKQRAEAKKTEMIANGWRPLDKSAIDEALAQDKRLQLNAIANNDWFEVKIDKVYKPHIFAKGTDREQYGLMKPRAKSRGYSLNQFNEAFCKLI